MTLVWLSPGVPADRSELATAHPADITVLPLGPIQDSGSPSSAFSKDYAPAAIGALPVGSLCVATVFETELLASLAQRPPGVRLLVIGPPEQEPPALPPGGRPADLVAGASSVGELGAAVLQTLALPLTEPVPAFAAAGVAMAEPDAREPDRARRVRLRSRLVAVGAILAGLGIGGIVIAATESSSNASPSAAAFPGSGNFGGGNFGGGQGNSGGTGGFGGQAGPGNRLDRFGPELLTCLRQQGITGTPGQLRQNAGDPALRRAFLTCVQQLNGAGSGGTGGPSSQLPARP